MATKIGAYIDNKGVSHPMFEVHKSLDCTDRYPVSMGKSKVRAILDNLEAAKQFVAEETPTGAVAPSLNLGL